MKYADDETFFGGGPRRCHVHGWLKLGGSIHLAPGTEKLAASSVWHSICSLLGDTLGIAYLSTPWEAGAQGAKWGLIRTRYQVHSTHFPEKHRR